MEQQVQGKEKADDKCGQHVCKSVEFGFKVKLTSVKLLTSRPISGGGASAGEEGGGGSSSSSEDAGAGNDGDSPDSPRANLAVSPAPL